MPKSATKLSEDYLNLFFLQLSQEQGAEKEATLRDEEIADSFRMGLFPQQLGLIEDKSRRKSALCPRRSGKSWGSQTYAFDVCLRNPYSRVVIITLTLKSGKNIYWFQMQEELRKHGASFEAYANELRIQFSNGSQIMLIGAENRVQIDKLRGGSYDLVIIDEAKSYPPSVLRELIGEVIEPALLDRRGTLLMIGTPGSILDGPFFESTYPGAKNPKGKLYARRYDNPEPYWRSHPEDQSWMWSHHSWTAQDNIAKPDLWEDALLIKEQMGYDDDHPTWQREFLGKWVASDDAFVYSYAALVHTDPEKVTWKPQLGEGYNHFGLPEDGDWHYILGMDLGFEDDFAAVIGAYNSYDGTLYQVWEYKDNHQDVDQVAGIIGLAAEKVGGTFTAVVADCAGLGKMVIETLNRRYGWNIQAADKREKNDHIELINADYHSGRCKLLRGSDLSLEKQALQWDTRRAAKRDLARTGRLKEHSELPNHLCDAWLYLWRFSYHYWKDDRPAVYTPNSPEAIRAYELEVMKRLAAEREMDRQSTLWDALQARSHDPLKERYDSSGIDLSTYGLDRIWRN